MTMAGTLLTVLSGIEMATKIAESFAGDSVKVRGATAMVERGVNLARRATTDALPFLDAKAYEDEVRNAWAAASAQLDEAIATHGVKGE